MMIKQDFHHLVPKNVAAEPVPPPPRIKTKKIYIGLSVHFGGPTNEPIHPIEKNVPEVGINFFRFGASILLMGEIRLTS